MGATSTLLPLRPSRPCQGCQPLRRGLGGVRNRPAGVAGSGHHRWGVTRLREGLTQRETKHLDNNNNHFNT